METPAPASRATVARHTRGTHRVVNDVEVGGAWRLRHPPRSIFVLSWDRGIAGVSASSALRDGFPSSFSSTHPHTLSTARRLISVPAVQFPRRTLLGFSVNKDRCRLLGEVRLASFEGTMVFLWKTEGKEQAVCPLMSVW